MAEKIKIILDDISADLYLAEITKTEKNVKTDKNGIHPETNKSGMGGGRGEGSIRGEGGEREGGKGERGAGIGGAAATGTETEEAKGFDLTEKNGKTVMIEKKQKTQQKKAFFSFNKVECEIIKPADDKIGREAEWEFKDHKVLRLRGCKLYENQVMR